MRTTLALFFLLELFPSPSSTNEKSGLRDTLIGAHGSKVALDDISRPQHSSNIDVDARMYDIHMFLDC